jgi:transcriptional antiterminator RfaH
MMHWYVVHTQPNAEAKAVRHLKTQDFDCFLPRVVETKRSGRQSRTAFAPLFPRYLFVRFDLDQKRWRAINGTRGVISVLTNGCLPAAVPVGIVEALLEKCDRQGVTSLASLGLITKGKKVRITSGAFTNQIGDVSDIFAEKDNRILVLLTLLGVNTAVQLPSYAVEAA